MVGDFFSTFLEELAAKLGTAALKPDSNHSCLIDFKNGIQLQLELDPSSEYLIAGCALGQPPAGTYRQNLMREALKVNGLPPPQYGIFAFSPKTENLVLWQRFKTRTLKVEEVAEFLQLFLEKALLWKEAIEHGDVPITDTGGSRAPTGMFGLR